MAKAGTGEPKKPYSPPVLTVHGTVRELTQAVALKGGADKGGKGFRVRTGG